MGAILPEFLAREEHRFEGAEATSGIRGYVGQELAEGRRGRGSVEGREVCRQCRGRRPILDQCACRDLIFRDLPISGQ